MTNKRPYDFSLIPPEIWEYIFRFLSSHNVFQCQKVCKAWYLPAQRVFLEHVFLKSRYDVEQFLQCFLTHVNTHSFGCVKKFTIGHNYTMPSRARLSLASDIVKNLIIHFPHVQQLVISGNCIDLEYFGKDDMTNAMLAYWPSLNVFRVDWVLLQAEKRKTYLQTIYKLRHCTTELALYDHDYITREMGGITQFLSGFSRLEHLKIIPQDNIDTMEKCLDVMESCQHLVSLDMYTKREDEDGFVERYLQKKPWHERLAIQERWMGIQSLKLTMTHFCINTIEFIIRYMTGLQTWTIGFVVANIDEWTEIQRTVFACQFLDFLCLRQHYLLRPINISYHNNNDYIRSILEKHFHRAAEKHLTIILYNNNSEFGFDYNNASANASKFLLQLTSNINERTAQMTHYFDPQTESDISLLTQVLPYTIDTITFNLGGLYQYTEMISSHFKQMMQQLVKVEKVVILLPRHCCYDDTLMDNNTVYPQVMKLEVSAGHALWIHPETFKQMSQTFVSLKYLSLWFCSGVWESAQKAFVIYMPQTKLERLHLDVTPVRVQTGKLLTKQMAFADAYFILKVTTTNTRYYRVALDYLSLEEIPESQGFEQEYLTVHIVFDSIEFINMYLHQEIFNEFRPVLVMDPQKVVQTTVTL
ncbi:hypothetical protein CU098_005342 [Rhizopus stolonifer]|uniref:F-box domain-containing protein n=1 Tax=Rhizopus stolonifer TaxID=4846 RepID=A0A367J6X9_RHIST|nr:hypothetical protein CU098_005342 [Rhizopus stolonifer]